MSMWPELLAGLAALLALVGIGYALGIVGNVGGPLFVLLLLTLGRLPATTAIGTAMLVSCAISLFAFVGHWRQRNVLLRYGLVTGVIGAVGCFFGAYFAQRLPVDVLQPLLGVVVLLIPTIGLLRLAKSAVRPSAAAAASQSSVIAPGLHPVAGGTVGGVVGFFCGAFGLGGATPIAALSRMLLRQPMRFSIGSAYLAALCISLVGSTFYAVEGLIAYGHAALLSVGCGLGIYLSSRMIGRIPDRVLEVLMLTTMLAMALFTIYDGWNIT